MTQHGTTSQIELPGWYIEFQTAVLRNLPRPPALDRDLADGWSDNGQALAKVLREALLPTESKPEPAPLPMSIIVDCDANPKIPSGLYLTGEGTEHRKMGKIKLEKRADGKLYANGKEVVRHLSPNQMNGNVIQGHKLRKELKDVQVLNACIMDALLANPQSIPEEWKSGYTYFWGTIFRHADGGLDVGYLCWSGDGWYWGCIWLGDGWDDDDPAASLAS